jgi:hypothetical protein
MTLTYVYSDSTAVVGPLAGHAEPHAYDLCGVHADRLTAPRGWQVVRLELPETRARREDIGAVAEAVREAEPEPSAPVRGRSRTVLRDVSLPRSPEPARRKDRRTASAPRAAREAGSAQGRGTVPVPEAGSAQRQGRGAASASASVSEAGPAQRQDRKVVPVPHARPAAAPAPQPVREAVAGSPVRRDVPMPEGLYRAHLRRPTGGAGHARPGT